MAHAEGSRDQLPVPGIPLAGCLLSSAVITYTTFSKVVQVPVVSNYVGANIFQVAGYIGNLARLYAPWLSKMMAESAGTRTALLLKVGSVALTALEIIAVLALLLQALFLVSTLLTHGHRTRLLGYTGYALALAVPLAMLAAVQIVAYQMTGPNLSIEVLALPLAPKIQIFAALAGFGCAWLAGRKTAVSQ